MASASWLPPGARAGVPYRHFVVTIPKRMGLRERMGVRLHRHRREEAEAALPGMIAVLQSWTDRVASPALTTVIGSGGRAATM